MAHKDVFIMFKKLFPLYAEKASEWFPNGKNSVRVRISEVHQDFVFTYYSNKEWRFETADIFAKSLNKK